jgi:hypothetical protein
MELNELLLERATRAYERARGVRGLGMSALVLPMVILSLRGCGPALISIGFGALLALLVALFEYRGGTAGRAVIPGLFAGVAPLVIPFVVCPALRQAGFQSAAVLMACMAGGAFSGAVVTFFALRERDHWLHFILAAGSIAALAGSLGCIDVGLGGIVAMLAGLATLAPVGWRALR